MILDLLARNELAPVAPKIFDDIAAKPKAIHDVRELRGMRQTERVTAFMQASEIDHGVAEERITLGYGLNIGPEARHIGNDVDGRARFAIHHDRARLAVKVLGSPRPIDTDARAILFGGAITRNSPAAAFCQASNAQTPSSASADVQPACLASSAVQGSIQ